MSAEEKKASAEVEKEKAAMEAEFGELDQLVQGVAGEPLIDDEVKAEPQVDENVEPQAEEPVEAEPDPQPDENVEQAAITEDMRKAALARGFSEEEISKFASSDHLDAAFSALDRRLSAIGREAMNAQPQQAQPAKVEQPKADVPAPVAEVEIPELELKKLEEIKEDYPEIVESFREMKSFLAAQQKKIARLESELEKPVKEIISRTQRESQAQLAGQVENLFASDYAKEYQDFIGKGTWQDLPDNGDERKLRQEIVSEMNAMAIGHEKIGIPFQGLEYLFKRALPAVLADKIKSSAAKEASKKINDRRKTFASRPGHRPSENGKKEPPRIGDVVDDEELLAMSGLPD